MKITILPGVGAVAGFVAGRLARIGHAPVLIARGDRLDAYREKRSHIDRPRSRDAASTAGDRRYGVTSANKIWF